MTTFDSHLRAAIADLRTEVEYIAKGKLSRDLSESERIRMESKRLAAHAVEKVADDHAAALLAERDELLTAVASSNWRRGRIVGLQDAAQVLAVRVKVARWWWQVPPLRAALASIDRLTDHVREQQP